MSRIDFQAEWPRQLHLDRRRRSVNPSRSATWFAVVAVVTLHYLSSNPGRIQLVAPLNGSTTDSPVVTLTGQIEQSTKQRIWLSVNGSHIPVTVRGGRFQVPVRLAPGRNEIRAAGGMLARLLHGSATRWSIDYVPDPGVLRIVTPESGLAHDEPRILLEGTVSNQEVRSITLHDAENRLRVVPVNNGSFSAEVFLHPNMNTIACSVGSTEARVTALLIDEVGSLEITEPDDGSELEHESVGVKGTVGNSQVRKLTLYHNGSPTFADVADGAFAHTLPVIAGDNQMYAAVGSQKSKTVHFVGPLIAHHFDTDARQWRLVGGGQSQPVPAPYQPEGGVRGGYLAGATEEAVPTARVPIDVILVFDTTSSMKGMIGDVIQAAERLVTQLPDNHRLAVVCYRDWEDDKNTAVTKFAFVTEPNAVKLFNELKESEPAGGGDYPEDQYLGIAAALEMWEQISEPRDGGIRAVIVLGDEAPKGMAAHRADLPPVVDDGHGNTFSSIVARTKGVHAAIFPIVVRHSRQGDLGQAQYHAEWLAEQTGGQSFLFDKGGSIDVVEAILKSVAVVVSSDPWMWDAPRDVTLALANAYGKKLKFALRQSGSGPEVEAADISLIGGGNELTLQLDQRPGDTWTKFEVRLDETENWQNRSSGAPADRDQIKSVLEDVQSLRIRAQYSLRTRDGGLDSVVITSTR